MAEPDPSPAPSGGGSELPARTGPPAPPALRASDADRERTADVLREAGGDGRLSVHELDERLDAAYAAVTRDDLEGLTTDLVATPSHAPAPAAGTGRVVVRGGDAGTRWLVAVMGGVDRAGTWRIARRCTSISVMGGADLDLTHVEFDGQDVHLRVVCVMGGSDIRVPEHMNVSVSNLAIMGGNEVRIGHETPDPGGPTLHLHLVSVMGGSNVERGPKRSRRERRAEREERRAVRDEQRHRHRIDRHG
ncbi:DUF1707 domain-containing protein [Patulibacter sp. NPDC049589]|uniref:DUF1707 SHOCT-like domain-containing protein n=1 Tax=Patulibacter sp. NPDC049589 TaxID=3154731 RepID=UPI00344818C8